MWLYKTKIMTFVLTLYALIIVIRRVANTRYKRSDIMNEISNKRKITIKDAEEYLNFILNTLCELIINRQIYLDVHNALIAQKANQNRFISWMMNNYYKVLILNLCKLLEKKRKRDYNDKKQKTLKDFILVCRNPENWETLKSFRLAKRYEITSVDTGEVSYLDFSNLIKNAFDNADVEGDLQKIDDIHEKLKLFRDKKIAHLTDERDIEMLNFSELHDFIDIIEEIVKKYYSTFFARGICIDILKRSYCYNNFSLILK